MRALVAAAGMVALLSCGEQRRYEYSTAGDVADAVRRGWLPPCIPPGSRVEAEQNIDTNESWGVATYAEPDEDALRRQVVPWTQLKPALRKPRSFASWPEELLQQRRASASRPLFQCAGANEFVLSIDWSGNRVFFAQASQ